MPKPITVYSKPACVQCNMTYRELDKHGIEYEVIDITLPENEGTLLRLKSLNMLQAPIVELGAGYSSLEGETIWPGFRPDLIKAITNKKECK